MSGSIPQPLLEDKPSAARRAVALATGRRSELDGIRGFAVLAVLGHNLGWVWFKGGFFGVDMFFALSGFLITTLLLEEHMRCGSISLKGFFRRRLRRLYPVLVALVLVSLVSVVVLHPSVTLQRLTLVAISVLAYFSNYVFAADSQSWTGGMLHTWSLAVEVHFYILWAFIVRAVTRRHGLNLRILCSIAVGTATASALWRATVWGLSHNKNWPYGGTDARLDAIFLGVAAAIIRLQYLRNPEAVRVRPMGRWAVRRLELVCIMGIVALIYTTGQSSWVPYLGGFTLVGAATAILILTTLMSEHSLAARAVNTKLMAWLGTVSYSIYIWHVPVGKMLVSSKLQALGFPWLLSEIMRAAACILVGAVSYYFLERAFMRKRQARRVEFRAKKAATDCTDFTDF